MKKNRNGNMNIVPFAGIGNFKFDDDFEVAKLKSADYSVTEGERHFMGERYKTLFVEELGLYMIFDLHGAVVDCFEVNSLSSVTLDGVEVFETTVQELSARVSEKDENLEVSEDGFLSRKFGLGVYAALTEGEYGSYPNSLVLYRKGYLESLPSQEETDEYYLGDLDSFMDQEDLDRFGKEFIGRTRDVVIEQYLLIELGENGSSNEQTTKLLSSFDAPQREKIKQFVLDFVHRTLHKALFFFEDSEEWAIVEKYYLRNLDNNMEKEILDQFGSQFIERTRDVVIDQYLMIKSGQMKSTNALALTKLLSSFDASQQEKIEQIVLDIIHRTLHKVLFLFEDSEEWAIVEKSAIEDSDTRHIAEISDGITGELYTKNGWIEKFSKFKADAMDEK